MNAIPPSLTDDPQFTFDAATHTYKHGARILRAAHSVIARWTPPFDRDRISQRVAERDGKSVETVLAEWERNRNAGSELGKQLHAAIEADLAGNALPPLSAEATHRFSLYRKFREQVLEGATFLTTELRLFSVRLGVAGTADLAATLADGRLLLADWKSNRNLRYGFDGFSNLLPPFDDLADNEGNKFALQLAIYRTLLREHNIEPDIACIVYLPPDASEPLIYEPPDLSARVLAALEAEAAAVGRMSTPATFLLRPSGEAPSTSSLS